MEKICIIGNGIAGITAARHIRKRKSASDCSITVISYETDYFFSRTALMYIYMGHMTFEHVKPYEDWFWKKNDIKLVRDYVKQVNIEAKQLVLDEGGTLAYDTLILATGSKGNRIGWPGEDLKGVQGMITHQDIQLMEENTQNVKRAVIVGGGLIGVEMAECLHTRHIPVTMLIREKSYWDYILPADESAMVTRHIRKHGIELITSTDFKAIHGDENGRVKSVTYEVGGEEKELACQYTGITVGVKPNIDFLKDSGIETDRGILVNEFLETNVSGVYSVGDCAQHRKPPSGRKPVEQIWYSGRMQGETVARTICEEKTKYVPGVFFNSAKFFDIEYQIYGTINVPPKEDEEQLYWEHKGGEKSIRIAYDKATHVVKGFNLMGIRFRHEVCDRWIKEKATINTVLQNLSNANFDPEFFKQYEDEIVSKYNALHPENPVTWKKRNTVAAFFGL
jgi:NAD(P)H-nitrite reductase large subunit